MMRVHITILHNLSYLVIFNTDTVRPYRHSVHTEHRTSRYNYWLDGRDTWLGKTPCVKALGGSMYGVLG